MPENMKFTGSLATMIDILRKTFVLTPLETKKFTVQVLLMYVKVYNVY